MSFHVQKTNSDLGRFEWLSAEPTFLVDGYGEVFIQTAWTANSGFAFDFITDEAASKWAAAIEGGTVVRFRSLPPIEEEEENTSENERRQAALDVLVDHLAEQGNAHAQTTKSQRDTRRG